MYCLHEAQKDAQSSKSNWMTFSTISGNRQSQKYMDHTDFASAVTRLPEICRTDQLVEKFVDISVVLLRRFTKKEAPSLTKSEDQVVHELIQ
jgi:hypothetical protein